jgi:uncharacterized membrane protein
VSGFWARRGRALRRHLIAGVVVLTPIAATAFVLLWVFRLLDGLLGDLIYPALRPYLPWIEFVPGLGILVLAVLLVLVGWAAELAIGSRMVGAWNRLLARIPLTRKIYGAANRIVRTVFSEGSRPFRAVVIVEYPTDGRWAMGFLMARAPDALLEHIADGVSVFIPTTPNPTTGYVAVLPRHKVIEVPLSIDQAFTFILSAGAVRLEPGSFDGTRSDVPSTRPVHEPSAAS